jgi:hypothetical protein
LNFKALTATSGCSPVIIKLAKPVADGVWEILKLCKSSLGTSTSAQLVSKKSSNPATDDADGKDFNEIRFIAMTSSIDIQHNLPGLDQPQRLCFFLQ